MNVAQLIEELQKLPPYYPVLCDVGLKRPETVCSAIAKNPSNDRLGPHILLETTEDPANNSNDWDE